ncbi:MAG TPA: DegQ family serine endoprotease [Rhabdochlamydiaceae bacterium]|jgi:serine protease Do|nr:DegQ family serine endoprotease [Rhabdochlamydiaceae bacterium]
MKIRPFFIAALLMAFSIEAAPAKEPCECSPQQFSKAFTKVAKQASPAVVFIKVEINPADNDNFGYQDGQGPYSPFNDEFLQRFFGFQGKPTTPQPQIGQGSGLIVSADGYIMTNAHVVKGADKIEVTLNDGEVKTATLIGADPHTDLAVIKMDNTKDSPYLKLGDSDALEVAEWVIAIGSPFQLQASVTVGVVSAKGRQGLNISDLEDFIQTDAAINPGNSGGPLLNLDGNVIGINTAIVSRSGGYMGIGFAIPSNMAKNVMDQIIKKGSVTRGFLGVSLQAVDKEIAAGFNLPKVEGVLISGIEKGSPADKAGLQQGDIILEYNNKSIKSLQSFRYDISLMNPESKVNLKVNRKGKIMIFTVTLGSAAEGGSPAVISQKLGIEVENLNTEMSRQLGYTSGEEGVVITKVKPGSPAAMAGIRPGFLIQAINHKKIANTTDYEAALHETSQNKRVLLLVRNGKMTRFYSIRID